MMRISARTITGTPTVFIASMVLVVLLFTADVTASMLLSEEGISPARSSEYVRTQSRNASTDADAVNYNPAGLSFLQNGGIFLIINSVNQYTQKGDSIRMWGNQGANSFNRLINPLQSQYQSNNRYLTSMATAAPTNFSFIFKRENWAVFADVSYLRGQPGATFTQSASTMDRLLIAYNTVLASRFSQELVSVYSRSKLKRQEFHIGATIGASYAFLEQLSGSLSLRYINVKANTGITQTPYLALATNDTSLARYQVPLNIDTDVFGNGAGIILGIDYKPLDNLNLSARMEYYPPMVLNKKTNKFIANPVIAQSGQLNEFCDGVWPLVFNDRINGGSVGNIFNMAVMDPRYRKSISNKVKATYPLSLSLGLSYRIIPALKIDTSADLTFPRARDLDGAERNWNMIGYRLGQSLEWNATTWVSISAGYSYNDFGLRSEKKTEYDDLLSSHTVGAGCSLKPWDFLTINVGSSYSFFTPEQHSHRDYFDSILFGSSFAYYHGWSQKLVRNEWSVSVGVTFSFYPVAAAMRKKAEEHYWKGMSLYLSNDIDSAVNEFKSARTYNLYYKDVGKKVKDLEDLQKVIKKNMQQEKEDKIEEQKKGGEVHKDENN